MGFSESFKDLIFLVMSSCSKHLDFSLLSPFVKAYILIPSKELKISSSLFSSILQAGILSGLPFPSLGYRPDPGIESGSPTLQADSLPSEPPGKPKNTGVSNLSLLQGIFPTQGLNPGLLHCRQILYYLSHQGNPRILEWVTYPFSRGSSRPRNWTKVSCIAGRLFTSWATSEAL